MPTEKIQLGPKAIEAAKAAALARTYTSSQPMIYADTVEKGLQLRVQASSITWLLRWNGKTKSLGDLDAVPHARAARALAQKVRNLLRDGTDPKAFLTGKGAGKSEADAKAAAKQQTALAAGFWTWERLIEEYTDGYLAKPRLSRGRIKPPSAGSADNAKKSLMTPEADRLKGKLVSQLEIGDLEEVRDACAANGRKTASRAFIANAKAALTHAKKKHARKSGLEGHSKWWLEVQILDETAVEPRTRMPLIQDLAKTLYLAEKHRTLEGRKNSRATSETMLCGLWWIALTAQRTNAAFSVEKAHILPWPDGPIGWKVVLWSETVMKSKRYHALPIPPRLVRLYERAELTGRKGSIYVFPSTALRQGKEDGHLDRNAPKNLIERLRGNKLDAKAKKSGQEHAGNDLLTGINHFSPHDIRRTFATVCADMAVRGDAISAVLDHAGLETGQQMMRSAEITRMAYDYSQRLELKRMAVEAWTNRLFEECDKVWLELNPMRRKLERHTAQMVELTRLSKVDLNNGVPFSPFLPWYKIMDQAKAKPRKRLILKEIRDDEVGIEE